MHHHGNEEDRSWQASRSNRMTFACFRFICFPLACSLPARPFLSGLSRCVSCSVTMRDSQSCAGCSKLASLTTSSGNYPPFMRFNPILDWSYRDVWDFIKACELPYCSLYDHGYTSLGTVMDTIRNPGRCCSTDTWWWGPGV